MFNDVFKEFPNLFGRRFLVNAFLPTFIFWGLFIAVAIAGQGDFISMAKQWNQLDTTFKTLLITGFLSWVIFSAMVLASQFNTILRVYEGYWDFPIGGILANNRKNWYQARLSKLNFQEQITKIDTELNEVNTKLQQSLQPSTSQKQQKKLQKQKKRLEIQKGKLQQQQDTGRLYENIYLYYPLPTQPENVMPTRLGNILKNAELYSFDRYEIDAVLIWPRLYNLFPSRFIQTIAEARSSLDFMLVISALSCIFALVSGIYLVIVKASGWLFLACFWGGLFLAWLAYRSALGSALFYAQQIKAGFDLYRNELLKQMRLELPKTPKEEIELWDKIRQLLYSNNTEVSLEYKDPDAAKSQNSP